MFMYPLLLQSTLPDVIVAVGAPWVLTVVKVSAITDVPATAVDLTDQMLMSMAWSRLLLPPSLLLLTSLLLLRPNQKSIKDKGG
jgi:hypothetical protein